MITQELLDACDVIYQIKSSQEETAPWYVLGYVAAVQVSESRNIARRSEVGSNSTILLADESQKQMSVQRLNAARIRGDAPYNKNLPAMIKWVVNSGSNAPERIIIDIDDPAFNKPFDLKKTFYTVVRENAGTGTPVSQVTYRRCKLAQLNLGIGAASKYLDDTVTIAWEETINEDLGVGSIKDEG
jgi:hypothetical protein